MLAGDDSNRLMFIDKDLFLFPEETKKLYIKCFFWKGFTYIFFIYFDINILILILINIVFLYLDFLIEFQRSKDYGKTQSNMIFFGSLFFESNWIPITEQLG